MPVEPARLASNWSRTRLRRRWVAAGSSCAALIASLLVPARAWASAGQSGNSNSSATAGQLGWIIEGAGSQDALAAITHLDPGLARMYFDNNRTVILAGDARRSQPPSNEVPQGWFDSAAQHYTAYGSCTANPGCSSFTSDVDSGALGSAQVPMVMFDDENWSKTPDVEKANVCSYMSRFTSVAHSHGLATIMAPDQNLASPGVITTYQGGETENWQTYVRLGLAACAAGSGTNRYHIMSQPFQTHWCGGQGGTCEGSESDFTDFVTEAALQAKAVNPSIVLTAGLTTNPRYNTTPQALFRDTTDVRGFVSNFWLNVAPKPTTAGIAVQYLEMLSGLLPEYLGGTASLTSSFPSAATPNTAPLAPAGSDRTFVSDQTLQAGTVVPAGTYKFEPWTDGSSGSATADLEVGYCTAPGCTDKTPLIPAGSWTTSIPAGDPGLTASFATRSPTTLPAGGPYLTYMTMHVASPSDFNLLYGTGGAATNIAVPRPSTRPVRANSSVLFMQHGRQLATDLPRRSAGQPHKLRLDHAGATTTFWTSAALPAGQPIPAGAWQFQYWTNGSAGTATVRLQAGYCDDGCTHRTPITGPASTWTPTITAGARGAAAPGGAHSTTTSTQLPSAGGPYHLYWTITVQTPGHFELVYGRPDAATNVATPLSIPQG